MNERTWADLPLPAFAQCLGGDVITFSGDTLTCLFTDDKSDTHKEQSNDKLRKLVGARVTASMAMAELCAHTLHQTIEDRPEGLGFRGAAAYSQRVRSSLSLSG